MPPAWSNSIWLILHWFAGVWTVAIRQGCPGVPCGNSSCNSSPLKVVEIVMPVVLCRC